MNHKTKFVSVFLALMLALSLALPVLAVSAGQNTDNQAEFTHIYVGNDTADGSIKMTGAIFGQTYSVYRIFDLKADEFDREHNAYRYTVNEAWEDFIQQDTVQDVYVRVDTTGYITWIESDDETEEARAKAFAALALAWAKEHNVEPIAQIENGTFPTDPEADTTNTIIFDKLPLGYFLIDSTNGTLLQLTTADPDTEIKNKNQAPEVEKTISKIDKVNVTDTNTGNTTTVAVGSVVTFTPTITVYPGAKGIVYHDIMDSAFKLDSASVTVKMGDTTLTEGQDYTFSEVEACTNKNPFAGCTFEIKFEDSVFAEVTNDAGEKIEISYQAEVTANVPADGNPLDNVGKLVFGDNQTSSETPPSETDSYTFTIPVFKYALPVGSDGTAGDPLPLAGAVFQLKPAGESGVEPDESVSAYPFLKLQADGNDYLYFPEGTELPEGYAGDGNAVAEITTDTTGKFNLKGLSAGVYYLYETKAPDAYNALTAPLKVEIDYEVDESTKKATPIITVSQKDKDGNYQPIQAVDQENPNEVGVLNQSGTLLPETGGIGTTIFYVVGGCLCVGAVVLLVTKRRMNIGRE